MVEQTESLESKRYPLRADNILPRAVQSKSDRLDATRATPSAKDASPTLAYDCIGNERSRRKKSNTGKVKSRQNLPDTGTTDSACPGDLIDTMKSMCAKSRAENGKPEHVSPNAGMARSRHAGFCINIEDSTE